MPEIYVNWYDRYGNSHESSVYFVDAAREEFLVVDEDKNFHWVSTNECELLQDPRIRV